MDGETASFDFADAELFKTQSDGRNLYDGAMDISLFIKGKKIESILDLTMTENYADAVASLVIQNPVNESQIMLFLSLIHI